ncbi:MAG: hypothetical protein WAN11_20800 [Syntrophobacteraceae bacterium]
MVPSVSHPTWAKLVKGEIDHKFGPASAGMLFFSLKSKYKKDSSSLQECIREARAFFEKYPNVFADDIQKLFK